ncbi:MAG: methyltransferase domain-containing protein [Cyanosarcina radialis HA8281-LM2]|jgi:ubiquinone/menaquinone biosynthesis C-methylase UbiE|nr:methyltransferase domain-containing protein [Cyanosarcina radialis HA8281-LM2]
MNKKQLFDRWAASYDWLFPSVMYQAAHKRLLEYVDLPPQPRVLDIGCGTGRLLDRLATEFPDLQGTGLDLSPEMLRIARRSHHHHPRLIFRSGNAENLPFADGQFDAIFSSFSFLHYPDPERVCQEVSRVLQVQGRFYLVDMTFSQTAETQHLPISPGGIRLYSPPARDRLGKQAGLSCLGHYHLLGLVLLTVFVS